MKIALDYDDTYTKDPDFWDQVIFLAKECHHKVYVVTNRLGEEEDDEVLNIPIDVNRIFFTEGSAKRKFMEDEGIEIDVWIDDEPRYIEEDKVAPV